MAKNNAPKKRSTRVWRWSFSNVGLLGAAIFFSLSLTPSLLPRGVLFQGFVSGVTAAIGYGLGLALQSTWRYLQLPGPPKEKMKLIKRYVSAAMLAMLLLFLWKFVGWQNAVRAAVGIDETLSPLLLVPIGVISIGMGYLFIVLGRSIQKLFRTVIFWLDKALPQRVAKLSGIIVSVVLLVLLVNGVLINGFFALANQAFSVRDSSTDEGVSQPTAQEKSGSPSSGASWETLGRQGRRFVSAGPTVGQLNDYSGGGAIEPVRVYAGLKSATDEQGRADLVLQELIRTGGFEREVLVVVTTTGTGWLDPKAVDPLEYMYNGDTAIIGVQYSYLPSWISMFADQGKAKDTSTTVFSTIHDYWRRLPEDTRPEIYVYGLSLGSFGAENIVGSINIVNEPIDGAVFSGPTLYNEMRNSLIANRDLGTPEWQPIIDGGRTVRFTGKENALYGPSAPWGDTKVVYTQYATDPVSFFSFDLALQKPDWLRSGQRGPDLTPSMRWIPFVTMWQVVGDLPSAGAVPDGYGHNYSRSTMVDVWGAVTEPNNWSDQRATALKGFLEERY